MDRTASTTIPLPCTVTEAYRSAALDRFVARLGSLDPAAAAPPETRARALAVVRALAGRLDPTGCDGHDVGYARCLLHEDPSGWSLAAIVLRPGQATPAHDHGGWGGAVTVRGVERDRRFVDDGTGPTRLIEHDYPPGSGYLFGPDDVHQPVGADRRGATVSLHFLARADPGRAQHQHEARSVASADPTAS